MLQPVLQLMFFSTAWKSSLLRVCMECTMHHLADTLYVHLQHSTRKPLLICVQVAYSVMDRRPSLFLSRFCESRGIPLLAYATLAGGFLADRYLDMPANM